MRRTLPLLATTALILSSALGLSSTGVAQASSMSKSTCGTITKSLVVRDGFAQAATPKVTAYNYQKVSANPTNALGTTIDFGAKALVVACVSPTDITTLSSLAHLKNSAAAYMSYLVKQSAGAMTKTPVAGVSDYLDFGNGKEDGLGSTLTARSVRLDAWVAGGYIFLTFIAPVTSPTPSSALVNFIHSTESLF